MTISLGEKDIVTQNEANVKCAAKPIRIKHEKETS